MDNLKPVKTYGVWFDPDSVDKMPPKYQVFIAESLTPSLYVATAYAINEDSPVPVDENSCFWHRLSQTNIEALGALMDAELKKLNGGREIHYSTERWLERR